MQHQGKNHMDQVNTWKKSEVFILIYLFHFHSQILINPTITMHKII